MQAGGKRAADPQNEMARTRVHSLVSAISLLCTTSAPLGKLGLAFCCILCFLLQLLSYLLLRVQACLHCSTMVWWGSNLWHSNALTYTHPHRLAMSNSCDETIP
tara:strand:- start:300 stop:611 length:312 start_codon:yes stop_codon:yes gene_type:complete